MYVIKLELFKIPFTSLYCSLGKGIPEWVMASNEARGFEPQCRRVTSERTSDLKARATTFNPYIYL